MGGGVCVWEDLRFPQEGRMDAGEPKPHITPTSPIFDCRAAQCGPCFRQLPLVQIGWPLSSANADFQLNMSIFSGNPRNVVLFHRGALSS